MISWVAQPHDSMEVVGNIVDPSHSAGCSHSMSMYVLDDLLNCVSIVGVLSHLQVYFIGDGYLYVNENIDYWFRVCLLLCHGLLLMLSKIFDMIQVLFIP